MVSSDASRYAPSCQWAARTPSIPILRRPSTPASSIWTSRRSRIDHRGARTREESFEGGFVVREGLVCLLAVSGRVRERGFYLILAKLESLCNACGRFAAVAGDHHELTTLLIVNPPRMQCRQCNCHGGSTMRLPSAETVAW